MSHGEREPGGGISLPSFCRSSVQGCGEGRGDVQDRLRPVIHGAIKSVCQLLTLRNLRAGRSWIARLSTFVWSARF